MPWRRRTDAETVRIGRHHLRGCAQSLLEVYQSLLKVTATVPLTCTRGSHHRLKHPDGRATTVPAHFPGYTVNVITRWGEKPRFEAVSRDGGSPYALISSDAREIWRELRGG